MAVGRVFPNEIDRLFNAPGGPIGKEVRGLALDTARIAGILATIKLGKNPNDQRRTGQFARAFEVVVLGRSTEFVVQNRKKYAASLEKGAKPHVIRARKAQVLTFKDRSGRWRKLKMVRHPGNPAFRILESAAAIAVRQRYGSAVVRG